MELESATRTLAALQHLPSDRRLALVMRHSLRYPITGMENVYLAALTPEGIHLAKEFGRKLARRRPLRHVFSSPVSRCVDTSTAIAEAAGTAALVRVDDRLSHVLMEPVWNGLPEIAQTCPAPREVTCLMELLLDHNEPGCGLDVFVTHDTVVGALAGYITGQPVKDEATPQYLEGMYLWQDGEKVCAWWRGKTVEFDLN